MEGVWAITFTQSNSKEPRRPGDIKKQQSLSQFPRPPQVSSNCFYSLLCHHRPGTAAPAPAPERMGAEAPCSGNWEKLLVAVDALSLQIQPPSRLNILRCTNAVT